jgi:hypothetical protein
MRRRRTKDQIARERAAYHEAGHAFMACYCGVTVHEAAITPNGGEGAQGHVRHGEFDWDLELPKWKYARDSILIALAGMSANKKHDPRRTSGASAAMTFGRSDHEKVVRILRLYLNDTEFADGKIIGRLIEDIWDETDEIIRDPENWEIIQRIAARLLIGDVVLGAEISSFMPTFRERLECAGHVLSSKSNLRQNRI